MTTEPYYIVGIDGGATKSRGVLFTDSGETISNTIGEPTNLVEYRELVPTRITKIITNLCELADISVDMIDAAGFGLAGASDEAGREMLFKSMDEIGISQRSIIVNDAEAAFEISCPTLPGFLVTVSTGAICIGRNIDGKLFRSGGTGHRENGDNGSGYWMGKHLLMQMAVNENILSVDEEYSEISDELLNQTKADSFPEAVEKIIQSENRVQLTASVAEMICEFAKNGNDVALAIVQEATEGIADYVRELTHEMKYKNQSIILAGNGAVIRNDWYRKCLDDALRFDFDKITWTFSSVSPAYGAGIIASRLIDLDLKLSEIVKGNAVAPA